MRLKIIKRQKLLLFLSGCKYFVRVRYEYEYDGYLKRGRGVKNSIIFCIRPLSGLRFFGESFTRYIDI